MKRFAFIFMLLVQHILFAQNEGNIWYFGANAGIDFNSGVPVALTNGSLNTREGCASISDPNGVLQFYTDGVKVWNRNHQVMSNGTFLHGGWSTSQSATIVKKPGTNTIYFIFTAAEVAGSYGLRYSEVDMSLQNGLGDINSNKNIPVVTPICEKVTVIRHQNNIDYWIVTHLFHSDTFHSYLLTSAGLNMTPVVSNIGSNITGSINNTTGYLKGSSDGSRIAIANRDMNNVELFDFNNSTGLLSNTITFNNFNPPGAYGIEFSPNNELLYVSESSSVISNIYQYDLQAGSPTAIVNSRTTIGSHPGWGGAIQLAPDNKIYHARFSEGSLGVVNNPNSIGVSCNYVSNGFSLSGRTSNSGLPNFYTFILANVTTFTTNNLCFGDSTLFVFSSSNPIDSVLWNFDDPMSGINNTSTDSIPTHIFQNIETYDVSLITYFGSSSDTTINSITINSKPTVDLGNDTSFCQGESLILDATTLNATYLWEDNSTNSSLNVSQQGTYWTEVTLNNCSTTDTVSIIEEDCEIILEIPNVFTPNNDGSNDLFVPIISKGIVSMNTIIYNRWGNKIFEGNKLLIEWSGQDISDGTYFWIVYYTDINGVENNLNGYVTILK